MTLRPFLAPALLLLATAAQAASDGAVGDRSHGSLTITASVARHVAVSGLASDVTSDGTARPVCVWLNTATRGYAVTAAEMRDLTMQWTDGATRSSGAAASELVAAANAPDCAGGRTRTASVAFTPLSGASAAGGDLVLVVAPE